MPLGTVLQNELFTESGSAVMNTGVENVLPPSCDTVTYVRSSAENVWYSRYTVVLSGFHLPVVCFGYTSIHGRSDAPGWLSARLFWSVQCLPRSVLRQM